jgi:hypothetical protein
MLCSECDDTSRLHALTPRWCSSPPSSRVDPLASTDLRRDQWQPTIAKSLTKNWPKRRKHCPDRYILLNPPPNLPSLTPGPDERCCPRPSKLLRILRAGPGWRESLCRHQGCFEASDCGRLGCQAAGYPWSALHVVKSCRKTAQRPRCCSKLKQQLCIQNGTRAHYLNYLQRGRVRRRKKRRQSDGQKSDGQTGDRQTG